MEEESADTKKKGGASTSAANGKGRHLSRVGPAMSWSAWVATLVRMRVCRRANTHADMH